jgi:hypothetical protein
MVLPTVAEAVQVAESVRAQEAIAYWSPTSPAVAQFDQVAQVIAQDGLPG